MTVFRTYLQRMLARPWIILMTIAVPAIIVLVISGGGGDAGMRVTVIDRDQSLLSGMVRDSLDPIATFVHLDSHEIEAALVEGRIELALLLPAGMQRSVVAGERARVETYTLQGAQTIRPITAAGNTVFSAAHNVALTVDGDSERFEEAMARVRDGRFRIEPELFRSAQGTLSPGEAEGASQLIGLLTFTMLVTAMGTSIMFLRDVETGTFHRTIAGPISIRRYMAETNCAFFSVTLLQAIAAALAVRIAVPELSPRAALMTLAILVAFALVAVSFTLAVANTMKTIRRTAIAANFLIMPMVMLGGAFWPFDIMPDYLQRIGAFSPTRWTTSATESTLSGGAFLDIAPQLGVLLLLAVVFGLLGFWRQVDVAK